MDRGEEERGKRPLILKREQEWEGKNKQRTKEKYHEMRESRIKAKSRSGEEKSKNGREGKEGKEKECQRGASTDRCNDCAIASLFKATN